MGNGIYNGFSYRASGDFIFHIHVNGLASVAYININARKHKINRLIHKLKYITLIYLVGWNGFLYFVAVKQDTPHFRRNKETLRLFAKQQDSSIGQFTVFNQM